MFIAFFFGVQFRHPFSVATATVSSTSGSNWGSKGLCALVGVYSCGTRDEDSCIGHKVVGLGYLGVQTSDIVQYPDVQPLGTLRPVHLRAAACSYVTTWTRTSGTFHQLSDFLFINHLPGVVVGLRLVKFPVGGWHARIAENVFWSWQLGQLVRIVVFQAPWAFPTQGLIPAGQR
jgi:hypothetical protein